MLQVICRPEATSKEEAYTFHTVHSEYNVTDNNDRHNCSALFAMSCGAGLLTCIISTGERPRKLYNERALNLPLGAELITGNIWYYFLFCFSFTITSIDIKSKLS